ncbi:YihY/virulence factor BrkB family protein [Haloterrigena sp. SYSU A121-1]|uniref:YihY/virulence factor BrkB family protein n=1 Tax=Haloterrigena gelatinilytica TaxID=2741724 RepID=A0A8J8GJJ4_9EURY|nr:YihY/virulence factor BrkB family protein [Haloterrigena gelatinilytica]NUB89527.1 YihY/virulence factor BrkB family protein [Haloterrigena gelatinilytica]
MDARRSYAVAREVVAVIDEHNVTFMAGSIAHAAFLSLLPLLLLLFLVAGAVGNEYLTEQLVAMARDHLSPAGQGLVYEALTHASERGGASLIGLVSLLWGMLRIFRGVTTAFDELYADGENSFPEKVVNGAVVFAVILIATVGAGFGTTTLAAIDHPVVQAATPIGLFVALSVAFFPMYYVFPDPDVSVRDALPGTFIAAGGWVILETVFGIYVGLVNTVGTFETFGAVILLLIWLYGNALILLVGAAVNVVIGGHHAVDREDDRDADGESAQETVGA